MRGTYTATYLACLAATFARRRDVPAIDVGAAFDLIVGTSTGGIIACALAFGLSLAPRLVLQEHGACDFSATSASRHAGVDLVVDIFARKRSLQSGAQGAPRRPCRSVSGQATLVDFYNGVESHWR